MAGYSSGNEFALTCEFCFETVFPNDNYCSFCGKELDKEELLIKYYFRQGYEYDVIVLFLSKFHGIEMSLRTLKNRHKSLGLGCRGAHFDETEVRVRIQQELDGPGCLSGYRSVWHTLRREGFTIPRHSVEMFLREMDLDGCEMRRRHQLQRRTYVNPGPNFCCAYGRLLKPYGFPIHACIDGFSRKVLWLRVTQTNNDNGGCRRKFELLVELKMVY